MLTAMTTGHDGSLSTVHAGSPEEALRRVETLALMADVGLPHAAIREQVADAIDLVVHQARRARRRAAGRRGGRGRARRGAAPATRELYALRGGRPRAGARRWGDDAGARGWPEAGVSAVGRAARSPRGAAALAASRRAWEALARLEQAALAARRSRGCSRRCARAGRDGPRADARPSAAGSRCWRAAALLAAGWLLAGPVARRSPPRPAGPWRLAALVARARRAGAPSSAARAPACARALADALGGRPLDPRRDRGGRPRRRARRRGRRAARRAARALALGEPTEAALERLRRRAAAPRLGHDRRRDPAPARRRRRPRARCCASSPPRSEAAARVEARRARRDRPGALHRPGSSRCCRPAPPRSPSSRSPATLARRSLRHRRSPPSLVALAASRCQARRRLCCVRRHRGRPAARR